jgi:glycine dehydrogenase subunit 1
MAYIPHTPADIQQMLQSLGVDSIDDLFSDIPDALQLKQPINIPSFDEFHLQQFFQQAAHENRPVAPGQLFLGAGAYQHYIPAAVSALVSRGEFVTSYTPYQAEVSQGTLQAIYEFQSHLCALTGMDVANASMYDGATALAEAVTMAMRVKKGNRVLLSETLHPNYRAVCETFLRELDVEIGTLDECDGQTDWSVPSDDNLKDVVAVVIQTPNFLGNLEETAPARDLADRADALLVAVCNPVALAVMQTPGEFGADITVGEAQPLGIPLQFGGPYCGYFACREAYIRKMPGRLVGMTEDHDGNPGYTLTLQTREQHIRRDKATSNICTNQGLFALMATIHMTLLGKEGLIEVAETCLDRCHSLVEKLSEDVGLFPAYPEAPSFNEAVVKLPIPASEFCATMRREHDIVAGFDLGKIKPDWEYRLLVCATELNSPADITAYVRAAQQILAHHITLV